MRTSNITTLRLLTFPAAKRRHADTGGAPQELHRKLDAVARALPHSAGMIEKILDECLKREPWETA